MTTAVPIDVIDVAQFPTALQTHVRSYAGIARPTLSRLADLSEEIAATLNATFRNPESAAKQMTSVIPATMFREQTLLRADVKDAENRLRRDASAWLATETQALERARAVDPNASDPEAQQIRLLMLGQADGLSRLPALTLLGEGVQLAKAGDIRGAQTRLMAARLAGAKAMSLKPLQAAVDKALDSTEPHRVAAVQRHKAAQAAYREVLLLIAQTNVAVDMLGRSPVTNPESAVSKARDHVGRLADVVAS